ncbi:uncharacterized protein [Nicotiana tomentosiformis]|uniref:uncharacterized protein n=1 Tax=Nicotiana tomentosiformis TaxID=4098 RepID=UPI00388CAC9D
MGLSQLGLPGGESGGGQARCYAFPTRLEAVASDAVITDHVYRSCVVTIRGYETRVDLLLLNMVYFEVILGMDWLSMHHSILDSHAMTLTLAMPGLPSQEWRDSLSHTPSRVISFLKAQRIVENRCLEYLAFVRDVSIDTPTVELVQVVREFLNVFPADLLGMPPNRDIGFGIDLVPCT